MSSEPAIITHIALTGYPASGKSTLGGILSSKAAYRHISTDNIRKGILEDKSPMQLTGDEWALLYSEVGAAKGVYLLGGDNVATENCAFSDPNRRIMLHVSPVLAEYLKDKNVEIRRLLVQLDADISLIRERNEKLGRGPDFQQYIDWLNLYWTAPGDLSDDYGLVEVVRYDNEKPGDMVKIKKDLGSRLGTGLL